MRRPPREHKLAAALASGVLALFLAGGTARAEPVPAALFGFELFDTSLQGEKQGSVAEEARLGRLDAELRDLLQRDGRYAAVDIGPVAQAAKHERFRTCDGCEVDLAKQLEARVSVVGWVQKVSNLILNITVVMRDVASGNVVHAASVDLRGDTDESWSRGLRYLVDNRLFPAPAQ